MVTIDLMVNELFKLRYQNKPPGVNYDLSLSPAGSILGRAVGSPAAIVPQKLGTARREHIPYLATAEPTGSTKGANTDKTKIV
jgi:hypothetical protein